MLLGFTAEHASRLTGLTDRQLRYWDQTEFFRPSYSNKPGRPYGRVYSFRDIVGLRTIAILRRDYSVSLQELRKVGAWLSQRFDEPWSRLRFYVAGGRVYFDDPRATARRAAWNPNQTVIPFEMQEVAATAARQAETLRQRTADEFGQIVRHRYVSHNQPVIAGTRIRTEAIWNFHQAGYSLQQILEQYPRLTEADVEAALEFERDRCGRLAS